MNPGMFTVSGNVYTVTPGCISQFDQMKIDYRALNGGRDPCPRSDEAQAPERRQSVMLSFARARPNAH